MVYKHTREFYTRGVYKYARGISEIRVTSANDRTVKSENYWSRPEPCGLFFGRFLTSIEPVKIFPFQIWERLYVYSRVEREIELCLHSRVRPHPYFEGMSDTYMASSKVLKSRT